MIVRVPPLIQRFPFTSTASVSPAAISIVMFPPLISRVGVLISDFREALIPSSAALMLISPSLTRITVASRHSLPSNVKVPPSICVMVVAWIASSAACMSSVPPEIYTYPVVVSSSFSACRPSLSVRMLMFPPAMAMASLASSASEVQVISRLPPVIFRSSLQEMPLSDDWMVREPVPFSTRSSREKITASVLVSPSAVNSPVTDSVLSEPVVVTKTLSAFFT